MERERERSLRNPGELPRLPPRIGECDLRRLTGDLLRLLEYERVRRLKGVRLLLRFGVYEL
jgi:hypothetical protein